MAGSGSKNAVCSAVAPVRVTVTKVRYGDDLGVPLAGEIDGRYLVVFAKVRGTDDERSVPMRDALRDLNRAVDGRQVVLADAAGLMG